MQCHRCINAFARQFRPSAGSKRVSVAKGVRPQLPLSSRPFSHISPRRPAISIPARSTIQPSVTDTASLDSTPSTSMAQPILDLMPKISSHPSLLATQVRNGPRDTYDPSHFVRKRRHGFLSRVKTRTGRAILKRRRAKGRKNMSH
ncbi:hypothetical protein K402DRAFT_384739 [Aulographum hederae CBS 113979]|uniref:Large ribosomal subunit protein bL34m n=1 Tax=Aulographum hederae CBS 113979 TaxID=1176131 RepID=A0A6G1GNK9_9PEZI|nr:hypothetical protein K402DRAFT_384739 [Aulographum hederae CBS 113979]